jgi:predicted aldo/keto reductase-like oxidoreductase
MDQVDILYSHSVSTPEWLNHRAVLGAMEELKSQKKTRFIGFTTHANMNEMLKDATRTGAYDVALASFNYSFSDYREYEETLEQAAARGIGLVAMKTQCQQPWYKAANPEGVRRFYDGEIVHSALLKWVLRHDCISCAVPGYTAFGQVEEDLPAGFSLEYTAQEKKFLEDRNVKLGMTSVCRLCGECVPSCPANADIPALMRVHMYSTEYGNVFHARQVLDELPAGRAVRACASCAHCSARCTRGVDIDRRIGELKALFA